MIKIVLIGIMCIPIQIKNPYTQPHHDYSNTINKWGSNLEGIITHFTPNPKSKKQLILTLDACGGKRGSQFDTKLITFLEQKHIKATLFINARWIQANKQAFLKLAANPLFEIQNHGFRHKPLAITPREIYHISSTQSIQEIIDEIQINSILIEKLTHKTPHFFRSGTAYYDTIALQILNNLGYKAIGFSISADHGATLPEQKIKENIFKAKSGDIIIAHINQPQSDIAKALIQSLPKLIQQGFEFKLLSEVKLK